MGRSVLVVMFLWGSMACASANTKAPLFVVSGGFNSCLPDKMGASSPHTMAFLEDFECHVGGAWPAGNKVSEQPKFFHACFDAKTNENDSRLRFGNAPPAGEVGTVSSMKLANHADAIAAFADAIEKEAGDRPVIFIGHSHGGWLSMKTALKLGKRVNVQGQILLDPISRSKCDPGEINRAFNKLASVIKARDLASVWNALPKPSPDCLTFPPDFSKNDLETLFKNRKAVLNVYQAKDTWLHSGPIPGEEFRKLSRQILQPTVSEERLKGLDPVARLKSRYGHMAIWRDVRSWDAIRSELSTKFEVELGHCEFSAPMLGSGARNILNRGVTGGATMVHRALLPPGLPIQTFTDRRQSN